eukprot:6485119-Amphidinium_carterae.2
MTQICDQKTGHIFWPLSEKMRTKLQGYAQVADVVFVVLPGFCKIFTLTSKGALGAGQGAVKQSIKSIVGQTYGRGSKWRMFCPS